MISLYCLADHALHFFKDQSYIEQFILFLLYEAAEIDGAGKWQQTLHVTIPGITPTIITMFILRVGNLMSMGYEKTILLYSSATYETADIISSYIYRVGLQEQSWSYSTAIGLLNSIINCILLVITNKISKRVAETSLW